MVATQSSTSMPAMVTTAGVRRTPIVKARGKGGGGSCAGEEQAVGEERAGAMGAKGARPQMYILDVATDRPMENFHRTLIPVAPKTNAYPRVCPYV
ncbi:unnamed protein product [Urochloa humidicola]